MKAKYSYLIVLPLAIVALIVNFFLFFLPHIKGDYLISYTSEERLQAYLKGDDLLEIFWGHDYWKSTENEYHTLIKGEPKIEFFQTQDWLTGQNEEIVEIVENEDIKVETQLIAINTQNFRLSRKYTIKNEYLQRDLDTIFIQLIVASDLHSYTKEENRLNLTSCKLVIDKPRYITMRYDYRNSFLELAKGINGDTKNDNVHDINLNFHINCD